MAGGSFAHFFEHDPELILSPSQSRRNSEDSDSSWDSSLSSTLKENNSILSCSDSELSVRTGSTAFKLLPPRPAPPPPPTLNPTSLTASPREMYSLLSCDTSPSVPPMLPTKRPSVPRRDKSVMSKTLSLSKKPRLSRTLSSDPVVSPQPLSLPANQISRTFSSYEFRRLLYSLPPAYPPPSPPSYLSLLPPSPPISPIPPLPKAPPPPISPRFERWSSPTGNNMSSSSVPTIESHPNEDERSGSHTSCQSNGFIDEPGKCRQFCLDYQCLALISFLSLALSAACCVFTAYHFTDGSLGSPKFQICLPKDSLKHYHRLLKNLITENKSQYCANTKEEISDLIQAMFTTVKNNSESLKVTEPKYRPVSAHVRFQAHSTTYNNNHGSPELLTLSQPREHPEALFRLHANDVAVTPCGLNINRTGTYFVYSSMHFKPRVPRLEYKVWEHNITLKRASDVSSKILAHSRHSCFTNCDGDVHTSYTGGVFRLQQHDLVYVNVTSRNLVEPESQGSYLGLIMIGSDDG